MERDLGEADGHPRRDPRFYLFFQLRGGTYSGSLRLGLQFINVSPPLVLSERLLGRSHVIPCPSEVILGSSPTPSEVQTNEGSTRNILNSPRDPEPENLCRRYSGRVYLVGGLSSADPPTFNFRVERKSFYLSSLP